MLTKGKLKRIQLLIPENQKEFLDEVAQSEGVSFSALVRDIFAEYQRKRVEQELEEAAHALYDEYKTNEELIAFRATDGDNFV